MLVAAGIVGVCISMLGYWLMVSGRVCCHGPIYLGMNVLAAVLILLSLIDQFNIPTLMINAFYGVVSIWGLWKCSQKNSTSPSA